MSSGSFAIHHLPSELLAKILFLLDGYTLNSTLEAVPDLCKRFVLVSDRQQTAVFTCRHLRRVNLSDYNACRFRSFFKLYEVDDMEGNYFKDGMVYFKSRYPLFFESLDRYCFLHMTTPHSGQPKVAEFIHEVFLTGATAEISHCPAGVTLTNPTSEAINELCLSDRRSVIIRDVEVVENLEVPDLESLTIVFLSCPEPVLRNVKLSKRLKSLKIVYYGVVPIIDSVTTTKGSVQERVDSVLEFVHAPSMKTHIQGALPYDLSQCLNKTTRYSLKAKWQGDHDMPIFGAHFQRINLIGGHLNLLRELLNGYPRDPYLLQRSRMFDGPFARQTYCV